MRTRPLRLGVLVSGRGSNMEALMKARREGKLEADVVVVVSDRENALALGKARQQGISALFIDPKEFGSKKDYEEKLIEQLEQYQVDLVILAGYMRILSPHIVQRFKSRVLNIHPSLLPAFPGLDPQKKALDYGVKVSGCTVHFVDEGMDTGPILLQQTVPVMDDDDEDSLGERILRAEHDVYWRAIQLIVEGKIQVQGRKVVMAREGDEGKVGKSW